MARSSIPQGVDAGKMRGKTMSENAVLTGGQDSAAQDQACFAVGPELIESPRVTQLGIGSRSRRV